MVVNSNDFRLLVARYTASGVLDTTFNGSGYSVLHPAGISQMSGGALTLLSNGKVIVTGTCTGSTAQTTCWSPGSTPMER